MNNYKPKTLKEQVEEAKLQERIALGVLDEDRGWADEDKYIKRMLFIESQRRKLDAEAEDIIARHNRSVERLDDSTTAYLKAVENRKELQRKLANSLANSRSKSSPRSKSTAEVEKLIKKIKSQLRLLGKSEEDIEAAIKELQL